MGKDNTYDKRKTTRLILVSLMVLYACLVAYWMLFGFGRTLSPIYRFNAIPFLTLFGILTDNRTTLAYKAVNLVGNIGVFMPFGMSAAAATRGRVSKSYSAFFFAIFGFEIVQCLSRRGAFDIDDIILNSIGFLSGFAAVAVIQRKTGGSRIGAAVGTPKR